jgi:hypothetical protein
MISRMTSSWSFADLLSHISSGTRQSKNAER